MNHRTSKTIAALLMMLLTLQAPIALAFACADHGSKVIESATVQMDKSDCHSQQSNQAPQKSVANDCCDDCACPAAMAAGITPPAIYLDVISALELNPAHSAFGESVQLGRIAHPPIS